MVGVGGAYRAAGAVGVQETTRPLLIVEQIVQRVRRSPDRRAVAGVGRAAGSQSNKEGAAQVAQVAQVAANTSARLLIVSACWWRVVAGAAIDRRPRR